MQQSEAVDYPCLLLPVLYQQPNMHSSLPAQLSQLVIAALYDLKQAQRLNAPCDCSECAMWMASAEQQLNEPNERERSAVGLVLCRICARCMTDGVGLQARPPGVMSSIQRFYTKLSKKVLLLQPLLQI